MSKDGRGYPEPGLLCIMQFVWPPTGESGERSTGWMMSSQAITNSSAGQTREDFADEPGCLSNSWTCSTTIISPHTREGKGKFIV